MQSCIRCQSGDRARYVLDLRSALPRLHRQNPFRVTLLTLFVTFCGLLPLLGADPQRRRPRSRMTIGQPDLAGGVEGSQILHAEAGEFVDCSTDAAVVRRDIRIERGCGGSHAGGELHAPILWLLRRTAAGVLWLWCLFSHGRLCSPVVRGCGRRSGLWVVSEHVDFAPVSRDANASRLTRVAGFRRLASGEE